MKMPLLFFFTRAELSLPSQSSQQVQIVFFSVVGFVPGVVHTCMLSRRHPLAPSFFEHITYINFPFHHFFQHRHCCTRLSKGREVNDDNQRIPSQIIFCSLSFLGKSLSTQLAKEGFQYINMTFKSSTLNHKPEHDFNSFFHRISIYLKPLLPH